MRVIAGDLKGQKLFSPVNRDVRPTSDKVKGAIFSMIFDALDGAQVLDLFAGTGNLGIEALSRGASHCVFCDREDESIAVISKNLQKTGVAHKSTLVHGDYHRALKYGKMDLIFADPPYGQGLCRKVLTAVSERDILSEDGLLVLERGDGEPNPGETESLALVKSKRYGRTWVDIYRRL